MENLKGRGRGPQKKKSLRGEKKGQDTAMPLSVGSRWGLFPGVGSHLRNCVRPAGGHASHVIHLDPLFRHGASPRTEKVKGSRGTTAFNAGALRLAHPGLHPGAANRGGRFWNRRRRRRRRLRSTGPDPACFGGEELIPRHGVIGSSTRGIERQASQSLLSILSGGRFQRAETRRTTVAQWSSSEG